MIDLKLIEEKAISILTECDTAMLASVTEEGYPRPVPMGKIKADGISQIWFSTGTFSDKTIQFQLNPKAGVCFMKGGDSIVLTGKVEIVSDMEIKLDKENGKSVYEIEFSYKNSEYEYDIDASTGEILKFEKTEKKKQNTPEGSDSKDTDKKPSDTADCIGEGTARELVLSFAGLNAADITNYRSESYAQDDVPVYKIKLRAGGYQYGFDVNALTGEIVKYEKQPEY